MLLKGDSDVAFGVFDQFALIITYYTSRTLSFQNDILRAAQGMLHKLTIITGTHCFEGLLAPLDVALLFGIHKLQHQVFRRDGYPSYSWTNWTSIIRYHYALANDRKYTICRIDKAGDEWREDHGRLLRCWILWRCVSKNGKMHRVDGSGRLCKKLHLKVEET